MQNFLNRTIAFLINQPEHIARKQKLALERYVDYYFCFVLNLIDSNCECEDNYKWSRVHDNFTQEPRKTELFAVDKLRSH
jgi:hypothetical protein